MKPQLRILAYGAGWLMLAAANLPLLAQTFQLDQSAVLYSTNYQRGMNYRSLRGVPLSSTAGNPAGSDGRLPVGSNPSPKQFAGVVSYGAAVRPGATNLVLSGGITNLEQNAVNLNLPRGKSGNQVALVLRSSQVGASTFGRLVSFSFGSVITPPEMTASGSPLPNGTKASDYWVAEPYSTNSHASAGYYWSPHAAAVFAIQAGSVQVTWRRRDASGTTPPATPWVNIGGLYFSVTNMSYVVSGAAVKTPQKIYWTEGTFSTAGKPVSVPGVRVGAVNVVYNSQVPERVSAAEAYVAPEQTLPTGSTNMLLETRTLWFEQNQIHAFNREGRVFVELLGDSTGPGTRKFLGFEIVDIYQFAVPTDLEVDLGERLQPYADHADATLTPDPLLEAINGDFLYRHSVASSGASEYYAAKRTENLNDVLVHWLKPGVEGLQWPFLYARYKLDWPLNLARYSHYLRPLVTTEAEAKKTSVALPSDNVPVIQYQDPLDQARGKLTETFAFYTFLDSAHPAHRTLLRFSSGERVAFERVYSTLSTEVARANAGVSVLDAGIRPPDADGLTNSALSTRSGFLNLDGATGYGQLPPAAYFNGGPFTVEGWVYVRSHGWWHRFIDFANGPGLDNIVIPLEQSGWAPPAFHVYQGGNAKACVSSNALALGQWVHLAAVFDGTNKGSIYLNGVLDGTNVLWAPNNVTRSNCYLGKSNWPLDELAKAAFDDFRIWACARTATEIQQGMTRVYPAGTTNLVAQYTFDEVGGVALDSSGNGYHMTLVGNAVMGGDPSQLPDVTSSPTALTVPRYVRQTVAVGDRITAPSGELGGGAGQLYQAGYILQSSGNLFNPAAYQDPFVAGFDLANSGAIIPVNAIPGAETLEVWWFRSHQTNTVLNPSNGFKPIYWPSAVGRYTLTWPAGAGEIILASNDGSGALPSLQARGTIYTQNDKTQVGYNPNEEHALMIGGQAYALRDDLNITNAGPNYSSAPYVLLSYTETDGRPAMRAFKVRREKPEASPPVRFDYSVTAGQVLQAPMPLPLLPQVVVRRPSTNDLDLQQINYNEELGATNILTSVNTTTNLVTLTIGSRFRLAAGAFLGVELQPSILNRTNSRTFYVTGAHAGQIVGIPGQPFLVSSQYVTASYTNQPCYEVSAEFPVVSNRVIYLVNETLKTNWAVTVANRSVNGGTAVLRVDLGVGSGAMPTGVVQGDATNTYSLRLVIPHYSATWTNFYDAQVTNNAFAGWYINCQNLPAGLKDDGSPIRHNGNSPNFFGSFTYQDRKGTLWVYRGPHGAEDASQLSMTFYYLTQPGFFFPSLSLADQPPAGTITPYLRPMESDGTFNDALFNPVTGCSLLHTNDAQALPIVYRPQWPNAAVELDLAETLTLPARGLPQIRGQSSLRVLYQQSIAQNGGNQANRSVVLHDPTREKQFFLAKSSGLVLNKIPGSANTTLYQGKTFFPNLPPHLIDRFFYDPNRGVNGALVIIGQFVQEIVGENYLLLNVLSESDRASLKGLVVAQDEDKSKWDAAIDGLETTLQTFREDVNKPGTYIVAPTLNQTVGPSQLSELIYSDTAVDSYALTAIGPGHGYVTLVAGDGGPKFTPIDDPVQFLVFKVGTHLHRGETKIVAPSNPLSERLTFQQVVDLAGTTNNYVFDWRYAPPVDGVPPAVSSMSDDPGAAWLRLDAGVDYPDGVRANWGGSPSVKTISDNYIIMRYGKVDTAAGGTNYSEWTTPQLAEGYIKRVLAGINPFNQRVTDLYNNTVSTDASILTSAGRRWEGDVALNLEAVNQAGLIEIYETVLRRGRSLCIDAGINYGPANDALLLAAGYLNDLYMMIGNEAYADASNPTIGIGTKNNTYGDIATSLFAFKGQVSSLLDEELALLRGRDDVLQPGVETAPVYNRLFWNYTRGIDSGEVIYALNYNILDQNTDGTVNAADAAKLFPQGHGDAYGHYLTALKGYYSLILNNNFDWVPRTEAVTVLGKPIQVDYLDERKFATAASALARTGRQIFDLTWRKDYVPGVDAGWKHLSSYRVSTRTVLQGTTQTNLVRHWGADQWASRVGQGALLNWLVGNAMLPAVDPDSTHEGIQKIDRTTVPELTELAATADDLQTSMDNAEGHLTPLGLAEGSLVFDIDPNLVTGSNPQTHFEQVYARAKVALQNAVASFDDAKDVTRLMRSEQDSLADYQASLANQELAYTNALIELYGTPYPDDVGAGATYRQGYQGPDLVHYMYVDVVEDDFGRVDASGKTNTVFKVDIQDFPENWATELFDNFDFNVSQSAGSSNYIVGTHYIEFNVGPHGFSKPDSWTGQRASPGQLQQVISDLILAHDQLLLSLDEAQSSKAVFDKQVQLFKAQVETYDANRTVEAGLLAADQVVRSAEAANDLFQAAQDDAKSVAQLAQAALIEALPRSLIVGVASGGDATAPARAALVAAEGITEGTFDAVSFARQGVMIALKTATETAKDWANFDVVEPNEHELELKTKVVELGAAMDEALGRVDVINERLRKLDDAERAYRALVAKGDRIQAEREQVRKRAAAVVQGYRTRDAAFRVFRNEKLERYKTLFDLAARYTYLAANAYDYETGLLQTDEGKAFINRIVSARSLGVVRNGEPQYAGSDTGDPGLSSVLAEMKADWDVLRGRLGFNNPDANGTTASLRTEQQRILPGTEGNQNWQDLLQQSRVGNILDDADVRRYCLQIDPGYGAPLPGIVLTFSTTIAPGLNVFGKPLAAGDNSFHRSSFATKIYAVGVALEGYRGMSNPDGTSSGTTSDPMALAATPYVYLIPVGVDSMRTPPLGDAGTIRSWTVEDTTIPLPFNIGASSFSTLGLYQSSDFLSEPLFGLRKHQAFRPVASAAAFSPDIYGLSGSLQPSQFTNRRLIGRSVWNSKWKLVIPGDALLNDPKEGLDRFIQTVTDIKLHFITYSYSGN